MPRANVPQSESLWGLRLTHGSGSTIVAPSGYHPALDGVRAFSVLFVIDHHTRHINSPLNHFQGWLGVDIFFVLSGFLITERLLAEERLKGAADLFAFYVRRAFRILPLYLLVLVIYVVMLQAPAEIDKWKQMKIALPYFLTFNNDIPLQLMQHKVGTVFGLSWTLGIEEKFYFLWPVACIAIAKSLRARVVAALLGYALSIALAFYCFNMGRAYSGLVVGASVALLLTSTLGSRISSGARRLPALVSLSILIAGFLLVDLNPRLVFAFSWAVAFFLVHVTVASSWMSRFLSNRVLVWFGKRSYAMYLIQGFFIRAAERLIMPRDAGQEVLAALIAFATASLGAALLHMIVEEPARRAGKLIAKRRTLRNRQSTPAGSLVASEI